MDCFNFDLTGRTALITGASAGLGAHFAQLLAAAGANIALAARRVDRLETLKADIISRGGRAIAVEMDVTSESSTVAAYETAQAAFGTVDTIIANAGMNVEGLALDVPVGEFERLMAINVTGVFLTIREGARRMLAAEDKSNRGRIIILSSINAKAISPGTAAYSASKAAVLQLGRVCAREWARSGINVNILCPGYIETDLTHDWFSTDGGQKQLSKFPRRRLIDKTHLDATVLHLASDASSAITGSVFTIDDGQTL